MFYKNKFLFLFLLKQLNTFNRLWSKKYPICVTLNKEQMHFDPEITKMEIEDDPDEKSSDKGKSPKNKKKFTFKKRDYQYLVR